MRDKCYCHIIVTPFSCGYWLFFISLHSQIGDVRQPLGLTRRARKSRARLLPEYNENNMNKEIKRR